MGTKILFFDDDGELMFDNQSYKPARTQTNISRKHIKLQRNILC